jgi:hypothetical protein
VQSVVSEANCVMRNFYLWFYYLPSSSIRAYVFNVAVWRLCARGWISICACGGGNRMPGPIETPLSGDAILSNFFDSSISAGVPGSRSIFSPLVSLHAPRI